MPKVARLAEARVQEEEEVVKDEDVAAVIRPLLRRQQKSTGDARSRVDGARHVGSCKREWHVSTSTLLRNKLRPPRLLPLLLKRAPLPHLWWISSVACADSPSGGQERR